MQRHQFELLFSSPLPNLHGGAGEEEKKSTVLCCITRWKETSSCLHIYHCHSHSFPSVSYLIHCLCIAQRPKRKRIVYVFPSLHFLPLHHMARPHCPSNFLASLTTTWSLPIGFNCSSLQHSHFYQVSVVIIYRALVGFPRPQPPKSAET